MSTLFFMFTTLKKTFFILLICFTIAISLTTQMVHAASTSNFQQTINAGVLSIDIVDGSYVTVGSPSVAFPAATFSFTCQTNTATFGTASQVIYIRNPDASDTGWVANIAASAATAVWDGAVVDYDFNDATGSGCTDGGGDADSVGGQMTVDPSVGTLATGSCAGCATTSITKGSSTAFAEGTTNTITLLNGAAGSSDIGDWKFTGVSISQKIPAETPAASDYDINMTVSVIAQ